MINTKTQISTIRLTFAPLMLQWVLVIVNLFWMPFLTENLWERTFLISEDFNHHIRSPSHSHHGLDAVLPLVSSEPPDHNCKNVDRLKGRPDSELPFSALNCFGCQIIALHCIVWALCPWLAILTDSHVLVCLFCTSFLNWVKQILHLLLLPFNLLLCLGPCLFTAAMINLLRSCCNFFQFSSLSVHHFINFCSHKIPF